MPRRAVSPPLLALLALVLIGAPALVAARSKAEPPLMLGGEPLVDPTALRVTVFADGLFYPSGMAELPDGSILVGTNDPTGGGFFASTGELVRLVDADGDGAADGPGDVLATGLPGALTAVRRAGTLIYAVSSEPNGTGMVVLRLGAAPSDPLTVLGSIDLVYETPMQHGTYALAVRDVPGQPGRHQLFFNVGSVGNDTAGATVVLGGLAAGTLTDASVYRLTVDDAGPGTTPIFSDLTLIATGLRNAAGLAFHPETGDLYLADNGIDGLENPLAALSADELNRILAAEIGGAPEDFGFPTSYVDYAGGEEVGGDGLPPLVAFRPLAGSENEGAVEIAVAPAAWPDGPDGVLVGFHGQWDEVGLDNEENPLAYVDLASGDYVHLVGNNEPGVGHLDALLATADALYVADLTGTGSLAGAEPTGVIYRIAAAPETSSGR